MDALLQSTRSFRHGARGRLLGVLFRRVAVAAMAGALGACGGGGTAAAPPPPPAPGPAPAPSGPLPAQLSVPAPTGYDADRLAAFDRLNEIRLSAGLGMLAQSVAMDQAAQAHALWIIANDAFTHDEQEGTPGFTGTSWARRDEAFGYVPVGGVELMSASVHGALGVDVLVNGVYHRAGLLAFEPVDVGIGWSGQAAATVALPLVIDMTRPGTDTVRGLGQAAQPAIDGVAIWPLAGATDVPTGLGLESPNPVPDQDVLTLGTPASVTVAADETIAATAFVLTERDTGRVVPTRMLTQQDDPNGLIPGSFVAAVPLAVLASGRTYVADFSGSSTRFPSGAVAAIRRHWSFTTTAQPPR